MHNESRKFINAAALVVFAFQLVAFAQQQPVPALDSILSAAVEQRAAYVAEFKNLLSQETKTFEVFDKSGQPKKRRTVVSTFIVYQSPGSGSIGEFRNVISVDGKNVENADKRAQEFFEDIVKIPSSSEEWRRIEKEGSRYDEEISINGLTLFQAVVLSDNLKPAFDFTLDGASTIDGRSVHVVSYRQSRPSRHISMDPGRMVLDGKPELVYDIDLEDNDTARIAGRFWIDSETFQIRKEERRVLIQNTGPDALAAETVLEYHNSSFSILTPKRLSFIQYRRSKKPRDPQKDVAVTFIYENFTRPDVEVKSADIKN